MYTNKVNGDRYLKMAPFNSFGRVRKGKGYRYGDSEKLSEILYIEVNFSETTAKDFEIKRKISVPVNWLLKHDGSRCYTSKWFKDNKYLDYESALESKIEEIKFVKFRNQQASTLALAC